VEPMLENLGEMDPESVKPEWVIVGAETGNRKEKVIPERSWIEALVDECKKYNIPIFMKSSLEKIWGEPLIQEFPKELKMTKK
jgi:protein gp37